MQQTVLLKTPVESSSIIRRFGLLAAFLGLFAVLLMPTPAGLPVAGHKMLGILLFAVIVWMTEAVSYPVSAVVIVALMSFLLGISPDVAHPQKVLGTGKALSLALSGFTSGGLALVGAALFIAAAMTKTKLDKRIALVVLSKIGAKTNRVLAGLIVVGFLLAFIVPSTTARVACIVPIVMGIIATFGVSKHSKFAGMLIIAVANGAGIWNVGIKTAAAQNMVAIGFIEKQLGTTITWLEWFIAAAPFAVIMSIVLYFLMLKIMPPEVTEIKGGSEAIAKAMQELGPMTAAEKKLLFISLTLLAFWMTEKVLHPYATAFTTVVAVALMLLPGIGIMTWKEAQEKLPWGTIVLFGVGISLGSVLLSTKAAAWLAKVIVAATGIQSMSAIAILAVLAMFLTIVHLGFASATALASAMIPIVISVLQGIKTPGINIVAMTMLLQYTVCFGFILPVNAPQNMIAYGTDTFTTKDFIKVGIPLTIISYVVFLLMASTYWKWLGLV